MKVIGQTPAGDHIVEMSPAEIAALEHLARACGGGRIRDYFDPDRTPSPNGPVDHWIKAVHLFASGMYSLNDVISTFSEARTALAGGEADNEEDV